MSVLEKTIENCANAWAKGTYKARILIRKMNGQGYRGWPDRAYWIDGPIHFMIEYKKRGEKPDPVQQRILGMLNDFGIRCYCADNPEDAKNIIKAEAAGRPRGEIVRGKYGWWLEFIP